MGPACLVLSIDAVRLESAAMRHRSRLWLIVCLAALTLPACSGEPDSPEAQVRDLLRRAELAAEDRDSEELLNFVSDDYSDSRGHDKQRIIGLLNYYFFRNKSIHLLTQVQRITITEPGRAETTVFVAMAGRPISGTEELSRIRADLHRFDFVISNGGDRDWQVTGAEWRRAKVGDFL